MRGVLTFPNPVNEKAARVVAGCVVIVSLIALATGWLWLTLPLALGFIARVASGPRFSPFGLLATRVIAPRLGPAKLVAGPPKRFAQLIGAVVTTSAAVAYFGYGAIGVTQILLGVIVIAATLESVFAVCLGCIIFGWLMRAGLIPEETCQACNNISLPSGQNV
jgi:hypothetical protein